MAGEVGQPRAPLTQDISWIQWFSWAHTTLNAARQSGKTAQRPTTVLWVGRRFFDVTLGKPVWVKSVSPVVWCDATGTAV